MGPQEQRRARLIGACPDDLDGVLVTGPVNVRYLSGFTGSNASMLVGPTAADAVLATDGRYLTQAADQSPDVEVLLARATAAALVERATEQGVRRLGIEAHQTTLATFDALRAAAADRLELVALPPVVEPLRVVKDATEIAELTRACEITDAAFTDVIGGLRPGVTESEVAWRLETAIRGRGGDGMAFDPIVGFGPHSAIPHHEACGRELATGDLVKLDFGALVDGYHADMTRMLVCGRAADWQRDLHATVLEIQQECLAACTVGAVPRELNDRADDAIRASGHEVAHGLGHGVGLQIHEDPFLTPASVAGPLVADVVLTIEPGIYLPGRGGVRIEDTVMTRREGAIALTSSPRELLEV